MSLLFKHEIFTEMIFNSAASKQKKNIDNLINKISKELGVEVLLVLHFIYTDLERLYKNKLGIHKLKLSALENEFTQLTAHENQLRQQITDREQQIVDITQAINDSEKRLEVRTSELEMERIKLNTLQARLKEINTELHSVNTEKKKAEYDVMIQLHSLKEKSSVSFKKMGWVLTFLTVLGILIAIFLIINKNK